MKLNFIPSTKDVELLVTPPKPATSYVPTWYLSASSGKKNPRFSSTGSLSSVSYKACMPFADALRSGYIQETWCDVRIETMPDGTSFFWHRVGPQIIDIRNTDNSASQFPVNEEVYTNTQFAWTCPWIPKTPKGWSILVTSPFNRFDLPFRVTSGIIDSDVFHHAPMGFVPFYVEKGFNGTIPAGTPMFQMIPIKREPRWKSVIEKFNNNNMQKNQFSVLRRFTGAYTDSFWVRKHYEEDASTNTNS